MPANSPIIKAAPMVIGRNNEEVQGKRSSFPERWLKRGNNSQANNRPTTKESTLYNTDSAKNWPTKLLRAEPTTFRRPISFALLADFAVDRLMKLIQAIN